MRGVLEQHGAPADLIQWVKDRNSRKKTAMFFELQKAGIHTISIQGHWYFEANTGIGRGLMPATASAMARICAGPVPQQPPMMLRKPDSAHSLISAAISSAVSS